MANSESDLRSDLGEDPEDLAPDWAVEPIPGEERLYYRVHKTSLNDTGVRPGAFRDVGSSMSTDWEKYSTPEESRARARTPADNAIVSLLTGGVRKIPPLRVEHSPDPELNNRAHTDVFGNKKAPRVRVMLRRLSVMEIPVV